MTSPDAARADTGFYCSTSGTFFTNKEDLTEHYKSDFHRYNLKRKVAGLPPVTKDWFDARKAQLTQTAGSEAAQKVWVDPLTKKKFNTENTYQAHVRSKRYQELVKKSGQPPPDPVILSISKALNPSNKGAMPPVDAGKPVGYHVTPAPVRVPTAEGQAAASGKPVFPLRDSQLSAGDSSADDDDDDDDGEDEEGWSTASEEEDDAPSPNEPHAAAAKKLEALDGEDSAGDDPASWEEWDVKCSLFDNHVSRSFEANLEYMWRKFGFYLPDAEYLKDPEGLLKYLGVKVRYGRVALYTRGDEPSAKRWRSLHAVQRHMVDTNQCKMLYSENEDEYAEFYDYSELEPQEAADAGQLTTVDDLPPASISNGFELVVPAAAAGAGASKVLGSRELARYYRQRHRPEDDRLSVAINTMLAKYRALAIATKGEAVPRQVKEAQKHSAAAWVRNRLRVSMNSNIINNTPKNVPY